MIIVPPEGSKDSLIAIIGQAPGATEELEGRPFCGPAGNVLNMKLHSINIMRQECYITNVVKTRPPGNDFSIYWKGATPKPELLQARDELLQELDGCKANIFIALGADALWALTGQTSIGKWRGSILECKLPSGRVVKVLGTYHPAAVLRQWRLSVIVSLDFKKALAQSKFPEVVRPQRNLMIAPTHEDILTFMTKSYNDLSRPEKPFLTYDIETAFNQIVCISLAFSKDEAMSIPTTKGFWGGISKLKVVLEDIEHMLTHPDFTKVGQNIAYDIQYLVRAFGILPSKPWYDTLIAQHACYPDFAGQEDIYGKKKGGTMKVKSLAFLASVYTDELYYKDDLKVWQADMTDLNRLWTYNAKDSAVTYEVMSALEKEIDLLGVRHTFNFMIEMVEPLLFMMLRGVGFDEAKRQEYEDILKPELQVEQQRVLEQLGGINPNSPKQVLGLIASLGLPQIINRKTGKPTTNKKAIESLSKKSPELRMIVKAKEQQTLISNYIDIDVDPIDKRLHTSFNIAGTNTGRISSSESVFGSGRNLQNFPKKIRDMVTSDPGMIFTECDLVGAEALVVAYLCEDEHLIRLINEGKNIHTYTANLIWGVGEDKVKADMEEKDAVGRDTESLYYKAKRTRHMCNYKSTWVAVSEQLGISAAEAKILIQKYYDTSPNLARWHKNVEDQIKVNRTLITPLGRKRIFFDRISEQLFREAIAYVPQETVASVLNTGLLRFYNEVCKTNHNIEILLQVHDSLLVQHPPKKKEFVYDELKRCMRVDLKIKGREFYIPIEIKSGINWRDLK